MTIADLKQLLEMGWPALVTLAAIALWVENRRLTGVALRYAERCGPPCPPAEVTDDLPPQHSNP